MIRVKNKYDEKEDRKVPDGFDTMFNYWLHNNEAGIRSKEFVKCSFCGKHYSKDADFVGGHVVDEKGNTYITPLCTECNNYNNEKYYDVDETLLVSPDEEEKVRKMYNGDAK